MKRKPANREPVAVERRADGTFVGSGNPSGRPKSVREVEAYAGQFTIEAINVWLEVLRDKMAPHVARLRAGELIVERHCGKPRQAVDHTSNGETLTVIDPNATATELRKYADEIEANLKFAEGRESILQ